MRPTQPASSAHPAQTYEDYYVTHMFRPWANALLDRASPRNGKRILDIATGTGIVARLVAQRLGGTGQVIGLDLSRPMLEVASGMAARDDVCVEWIEGRVECLPFPDRTFDLVVCQQGLQFVPDRTRAVEEMQRILRAGGRAVSSTWAGIDRNPLNKVVAEVIERRLGTRANFMPYALGDRHTLVALFEDSGFDDIVLQRVRRIIRFPSWKAYLDLGVAGVVAATPELSDLDEQQRAALVEVVRADLEQPLRVYRRADELVFPMETHIVVARKAHS